MKLLARFAFGALAVVLAPLGTGAAQSATTIVVTKAWARATPAKADVGVVYATITNNGDTAERLENLSTPVASTAMAHETTMKNGIMRMAPISGGLVIPAHATVVLKPMHKHIMLQGLKTPLKAGHSFPLEMTFHHAGTIKVSVAVGTLGAMQAPTPATAK